LYIYTATPISKEIKRELAAKSIVLNGPISYKKVLKVQSETDVLIHVESFDKKYAYLVRQSFSTKIVDYFQASKCIFAVGKPYVASIDYLIQKDAAIVAINEIEIFEKLNAISKDVSLIEKYALKSWNCGVENHDIKKIQSNLVKDIQALLNE